MSLNMGIKGYHLMQQVVAVAAISFAATFLVNLYLVRTRMIKLKRQGLVRDPTQSSRSESLGCSVS